MCTLSLGSPALFADVSLATRIICALYKTSTLGRKVSDEFTVPLCRGHHRELHRRGDEAAWRRKLGLDPIPTARTLWLQTHPLGADKLADVATDSLGQSRPTPEGVG